LGWSRTRHGPRFDDEETRLALLCKAGIEKTEIRTESGLGSNRVWVASKL
jgi:hypothetical protein